MPLGVYRKWLGANLLPTSGLILRLRADIGVTLNVPNGNTVSAWADQSGQGNNAAQAAAGNQPPYLSTGGDNGKAGLNFGTAGTVGAMSLTTGAFSGGPLTSWTISCIANLKAIPNATQTSAYFFDGLVTANRAAAFANNSPQDINVYAGSVVQVQAITTGLRCITLVNSAGNASLYYGETLQASGIAIGSNTLTGLTIGDRFSGNFQFLGLMDEIAVYNSAVSLPTVQQIARYANSQWGASL